MPRIQRTEQEIEETRRKILEASLRLIIEQGYEDLSMRKIASKLGISAMTIYNYFKNKDELYFYVRSHGFELLHEHFESAIKDIARESDQLKAMIQTYMRFGIDYPDYYEIMYLHRKVPKYLDRVETEMEEIALQEKQISLKPFLLFIEIFKKAYRLDDDEEAKFRTIKLWVECNGIISLVNSRLLREVEDDIDSLVERLILDICDRIPDG